MAVVRVVKRYPHDPGAFTQGLAYHNGFLYESTGLNGRSTIRKVDLETGEVLLEKRLPRQYFGEGIALRDGKLIQLTWRNRTGFIWNLETFELEDTFQYGGEGWGLTHDTSGRLIVSDGSNALRFLAADTKEELGALAVTYQGKPVGLLNDLQFYQGSVLANIWHQDYIARVSLETGSVTRWLDLSALEPHRIHYEAVLNGIAYDEDQDRLFVTGKWWPHLYQIVLA